MQVLKFIGMVVAVYVSALLMGIIVGFVGASSGVDTDSLGTVSIVLWYGVALTFMGWLATKVGYRWFDTFGLLVPILGVIWFFKWLWRASSLPNRYWEASPMMTGEHFPPAAPS